MSCPDFHVLTISSSVKMIGEYTQNLLRATCSGCIVKEFTCLSPHFEYGTLSDSLTHVPNITLFLNSLSSIKYS